VDNRTACLEAERPAVEKRNGVGGLDDGLALSLSAAMGSVAGLIGWVVSTRLLTPSDIGKAAEVVAAILMIGGIAQLNLSVGMLRWIPGAGRYTARLTWAGMLTVIPLGALAALVCVVVLPSIGPQRRAACRGGWVPGCSWWSPRAGRCSSCTTPCWWPWASRGGRCGATRCSRPPAWG
jgi:hypothetical protein